MSEFTRWDYYLHTNGDLIGKNPICLDEDASYFDSDFVRKVWRLDLTNRADGWKMILEALAMGADLTRCRTIAFAQRLDMADSLEFLVRNPNPTEQQKDGLKIFIDKILDVDEDEYWAWIASGGKTVKPSPRAAKTDPISMAFAADLKEPQEYDSMIHRDPAIQAVVDKLSQSLSGKTQAEAEAAGVCPTCGKEIGEFRNDSSRGEFRISGMCQICQDSVFGED